MAIDLRYIEAVFEPDDLVEVRLIPSKRRHFVKVKDITGLDHQLEEGNAAGENLYVGANPRKLPGGKAKDVALARCLFADIDEIGVDDAVKRIVDAGLSRSSGNGIESLYLSSALRSSTRRGPSSFRHGTTPGCPCWPSRLTEPSKMPPNRQQTVICLHRQINTTWRSSACSSRRAPIWGG